MKQELTLTPSPEDLPNDLPDEFSFRMEGLFSARRAALETWGALVDTLRDRGYEIWTEESNATGNKYAHCKRKKPKASEPARLEVVAPDSPHETYREPEPAKTPQSVIGEFVRLDKIIRECEESIRIADRLIALDKWQPNWDDELVALRATLAKTLREREWLEKALFKQT
jgi:hypothetical protein